jgi:hypothetical protein
MPYGNTTNDTVKRLIELPIQAIGPMRGSVIVGSVFKTISGTVANDLLRHS